jgi:hypothetical protein
MSKKNVTKANKTVEHAAELTEQQLKEQAEIKRLKREKSCLEFLQNWLKENNLVLTTTVPIHINGQPVGIVLKAL